MDNIERLCRKAEVIRTWETYNGTTEYRCVQAALAMLVHLAVADERERCAAWVDARRNSFCAAFGSTDPETGALEFGRGKYAEEKEEYVGELEEIANGLRYLGANSKPATSAPVT